MRLVLLGTNGFQPTDDGQTACFMLPELGIVLDAGTGLYRISRYLQTPTLDIYLTHAHGDHVVGLGYLFGALLERQLSESKLPVSNVDFELAIQHSLELVGRIRVHATEKTIAEVNKGPVLDGREVIWVTLNTTEKLPNDGVLTHFALQHTTECVGFRLDWPGHSLAYVTDTVAKPDAPYVDRISGVELLLHDCYVPDSLSQFAERTGHSHTSAAAQVAAKAQVGRLVLIHHNTVGLRVGGSELESARAIFPRTDVGLDGMEITF